jgi:hypothetical protein
MMIVEVTVLRHVASHPVSRPLEHQQIENAVVDRRASLDFLSQIQIAETLCKLRDQRGFCSVVFEPCFRSRKSRELVDSTEPE